MGKGSVKTDGNGLEIRGTIDGTKIDLGTGTLTVNNQGAHSLIQSLKAGGLTLSENTSVDLAGQGSIGHLKGATATRLIVAGADVSYTLSSAKDVTIDVEDKGELLIGDPAATGYTLGNKGIISDSSSELTNVTLNIRTGGKVQSVANYLGTGNAINNNGTLILKGGTLRSDITYNSTLYSTQIIIDGSVVSNNAINCSLIEFTITDASAYDQLTLQGAGSRLYTTGFLIDISDYTLRNGDSFTLVSDDDDRLLWMMNSVQLSFTGKDLLAEGFSYNLFNTGSQWGVRFNAIPEPSTATLSLLALAGLLARRRRQAA